METQMNQVHHPSRKLTRKRGDAKTRRGNEMERNQRRKIGPVRESDLQARLQNRMMKAKRKESLCRLKRSQESVL